MFVLPGVLLPLITLGVIFSGLVPGALIDTCGNRPSRGWKMHLFLWCNSFTATMQKWHVAPGAQIRHGKSEEGDGRRQDHAALHHLRKLEGA